MQKFTVCVLTLLAGPTNLTFLQLANDLRDSALIGNLHVRLCKMTNKVDDMHYKVDDTHHKVEDIHTILFKLKRSGTRPVSDSLARQEMPLKPEIFHGRDDMVEGIAKLLLLEETSRVHSRPRWDGEDFGFTCCRLITSHQGAVSGWKHCLDAMYRSDISNSPLRNYVHSIADTWRQGSNSR